MIECPTCGIVREVSGEMMIPDNFEDRIEDARRPLHLALPNPGWTKTPPTEPGVYHLRRFDPRGVKLSSTGCLFESFGIRSWMFFGTPHCSSDAEMADAGYEFWPVPVTPPK